MVKNYAACLSIVYSIMSPHSRLIGSVERCFSHGTTVSADIGQAVVDLKLTVK